MAGPALAVAAASAAAGAGLLGLITLAASAATTPPGQTGLREGSVPTQYETLVLDAAATCDTLTAPLLAAQLEAESGWNPGATSPAGAQGIAQFMPATWAAHGIDGNGDGQTSPWSPADAIPTAAAYDCSLARQVSPIGGDRVELMLAAYNAGYGAVLHHHGIPPYTETRTYVDRIIRRAGEMAAPTVDDSGAALAHLPRANPRTPTEAIAWARAQVDGPGVWYRRCEAFVAQSYGWSHSGWTSQGTVYAIDNYTEVPPPMRHTDRHPAPGALMYWDTGSAAGHVALYLGDGMIASNDIRRTGHIDVAPMWAPSQDWGARYVGWTEPYFPNAG